MLIHKPYGARPFWSALGCLVILMSAASAQEALDTILVRGYVSDWRIAGPLDADVDGGVVEAIGRSDAPLGGRDFLEGMGGVSQARPVAGAAFDVDGQTYTWQVRRASGPNLDLTDLFHNRREGVAYAYFNCRSSGRVTAYFDLQTPLGGRVWLNGFPGREINAAPLEAAGVDRFLIRLRPGINYVMIEVPLASLEALSEASGMRLEGLVERGFPNRPLLTAKSGFQLALRLLPVRALGDIAYVPRLRPLSVFSGDGGGLRQSAAMVFFNPQDDPSLPITVRTTVPSLDMSTEQVLTSIPPATQREAVLSIPIGETVPGTAIGVEVLLRTDRAQKAFDTTLSVGHAPEPGTVYVVTGGFYDPGTPETQSVYFARRLQELERHLRLSQEERDYGFYLGDAPVWSALLDSRPEMRQQLYDVMDQLRAAPNAAWLPLDQRLVGGETLARTYLYGKRAAESLLHRPGGADFAWDVSGLCPQEPQLLADARIQGCVTNLPALGIPPLSWWMGLDTTRSLLRRKQAAPGPKTAGVMTEMATVQRREMLELGIDADVLVNTSISPPPEAFFSGETNELRHGVPSIQANGMGAERFFDTVRDEASRELLEIPALGRYLNTLDPGAVVAQPAVKEGFARAESILGQAESFATVASLLGHPYPGEQIDLCWRKLLYAGTPGRLGFASIPRNYLDTLAACRDTMGASAEVLDGSLAFIAKEIDTRTGAPTRPAGVRAFVVFNACAWARTDLCAVELAVDTQAGLTIQDTAGNKIPYAMETIGNPQGRTSLQSRISFVASDVPSLGYKTYYAVPRGAIPRLTRPEGSTLETGQYRVSFDADRGGGIASLVDKAAGQEYVSSLMNDIAAIDEDSAKTRGGRDLWTTGTHLRISEMPGEIELAENGPMRRATVRMPFAGGEVVREVTLYEGLQRIDCRIEGQGLDVADRFLAATFASFTLGSAPVYGERFGAVMGRKSPSLFDYQTAGPENPSATAVQPAYLWSALAPGSHLRFGSGIAVPLQRTAIVYGADPALARAATALQRALVARGVPAASYPNAGADKDPIWSDSTEFDDLITDLRHQAGMRIVLGSGEESALAKRLIAGLPAAKAADVANHLSTGVSLFLYDQEHPEDLRDVPTLLITADGPAVVETLAQDMAASITAMGHVPISPRDFVPSSGEPLGERGVALFHRGSALANATEEGDLVLGLAHGSSWDVMDEGLSLAPGGDFQKEYALRPFEGTWDEARLREQAQAFNAPLRAVVVAPSFGPLENESSFLNIAKPGFVVTAVKPSGCPMAELQSPDRMPRSGITVRGFEPCGREWAGDLKMFLPLQRAEQRDLVESSGFALDIADNTARFRTSPFGIETLVLEPALMTPAGPAASAVTGTQEVIHSKYWEHHTGAEPAGRLPVSIMLRGGIASEGGAISVTVSNNTVDRDIEAPVVLSASAGWRLTPEQFSYYLRPGESETREVVVLTAGTEDSGGVAARTEYGGRIYRDVLERNPRPITVDAQLERGNIAVVVRNGSLLHAEGRIDLIVPPKHWAEDAAVSGNGVAPSYVSVSVPPLSEERHVFLLKGERPAWAVVRLAANGHVRYLQVNLTGLGESASSAAPETLPPLVAP